MQAVIIAAGEGKRMRPLTLERPKPLIAVAGRPILEHILDALPSEVDEIILVVGYKGDMFREHFGDSHGGRTITYVHQPVAEGTGQALFMTKPLLRPERFFFLNADDIHGSSALHEALQYPLALLATTHEDPSRFGVLELHADHTLAGIIEKPEVPPTNLISTGAMVLDTRIFDFPMSRQSNGEYYVTEPLEFFACEHPIHVVTQDLWLPLGCPADIPLAEARLMR